MRKGILDILGGKNFKIVDFTPTVSQSQSGGVLLSTFSRVRVCKFQTFFPPLSSPTLDRSMKKAKLESVNPSIKTLTASSLAKNLASCDKSTRDKSLRLLKAYLTSHHQQQISIEELKKIWKGLFYSVWHSDKQQVQLELINRLASLLVTLDLPLSVNFFQVFLLTIRREWSGIDYLRLDKFYLLNRRFLHHFFLLLKNNAWETQLLSNLMGVLRDKTLISADKYPSQGVNYHLAEIFLPELKCFLPLKLEIIDILLQPFFCVLERSSDKVLVNKVKVNVFDCLLENGRKLLKVKGGEGDSVECSEDVEKFGTVALMVNLSKKLFDLASSFDSLQSNRKVLFDLHSGCLKLENAKAKMGVEILVPMEEGPEVFEVNGVEKLLDDDCVKEVQDFIACSETVQESADRSTEKLRKKSKKALSKKLSDRGIKKSKTKKNLSDSGGQVSVTIYNNKGDDVVGVVNEDAIANGDGSSLDVGNSIAFDKSTISSLQKQFEMAVAEAGMDVDSPSLNGIPVSAINSGSRKRKRMKKVNGKASLGPDEAADNVDGSAAGKTDEKSAKKVSFSMKNNLIWKPHSPLPPQSVRVPPSATPRGSALKKGIPPGPVRLVAESSSSKKMKKKATSVLKKSRKNPKSISPSIKFLRKLQASPV